MKKYLLLRNNKQTGPHTFDELMEMGLKPHDLVWVEGKSASWRYPSEMDEFKTQAAVLAEIPPERSFTPLQNEVLIFDQEPANPLHPFEDELSEFPTLARFMEPTDRNDSKREKIVSTGHCSCAFRQHHFHCGRSRTAAVATCTCIDRKSSRCLNLSSRKSPNRNLFRRNVFLLLYPPLLATIPGLSYIQKNQSTFLLRLIEKAPEPLQVAASVVSPEPLQVSRFRSKP